MPSLSAEDDRLVHSATLGARISLCLGHDLRQLHPVDAVTVRREERQGHAAREGRRGAKAGGDRQVGLHCDIGACADPVLTNQCLCHTTCIVAPVMGRTRLWVRRQCQLDVGVRRVGVGQSHVTILPGPHRQRSAELDGHRKDREQGVIDVLADEVHTTGGLYDEGPGVAEPVLEKPRRSSVGMFAQAYVSAATPLPDPAPASPA